MTAPVFFFKNFNVNSLLLKLNGDFRVIASIIAWLHKNYPVLITKNFRFPIRARDASN